MGVKSQPEQIKYFEKKNKMGARIILIVIKLTSNQDNRKEIQYEKQQNIESEKRQM